MGAFFLKRLDERMETVGLFYVRFMDDVLVLAPARCNAMAPGRNPGKIIVYCIGLLSDAQNIE